MSDTSYITTRDYVDCVKVMAFGVALAVSRRDQTRYLGGIGDKITLSLGSAGRETFRISILRRPDSCLFG